MSVKMHVTGGAIIEEDGSLIPVNIDQPAEPQKLADDDEKE